MSRFFVLFALVSGLFGQALAADGDLESAISVIQQGASRKLNDAMKQVVKIGPPAVPRLLDVLVLPDNVANESAMIALDDIFKSSSMTKEAEDRLIEISRSDKPLPSGRAAYLLGRYGDSRATDVLEANAESESLQEQGRVAAVQALTARSDHDKYRPLFDRLKKNKSVRVRGQAVEALASLGDKGGVDEALQLLRDSPPRSEGQRKAIAALEKSGDARAIPLLQKSIDEGKGGARARLAIARIEFAQAKTDAERKESLRKSFRSQGAVGQWAADEILVRQKRNPEFRKILEEAAADPKHPQSALSKSMLKRSE